MVHALHGRRAGPGMQALWRQAEGMVVPLRFPTEADDEGAVAVMESCLLKARLPVVVCTFSAPRGCSGFCMLLRRDFLMPYIPSIGGDAVCETGSADASGRAVCRARMQPLSACLPEEGLFSSVPVHPAAAVYAVLENGNH